MSKHQKENIFYLIIVISMLLWGGSWTSAKLVSTSSSKEVLVFWRFFVTFISFIPVIIYTKQSIKISKKALIPILLGTVFLVTYNLLFFGGLRLGRANQGGVLVTTINPILTFAITTILFKQKIKIKELIGMILGITGGMILIEIWKIIANKQFAGGDLYFIGAALLWALLSVASQQSKKYTSPIVFSFYIYGLSALADFFIAIPNGLFDTSYMTLPFILNILYLSIAATTFATTAYFIAATKLGANKASSFTFLVPTSALFFSWLILGEIPSVYSLIGGVIALVAVYIINIKIKKKKLV